MSDARERASLIPPPASMPGERVAGDDLISDMFEAASELSYIDNVLDGASYVLQLTLEKLPSEVGMVSLFDLDQRSYIVVRQTGGDGSALLMRLPEDSSMAKRAMKSKQTIIESGASIPKAIGADERWAVIGLEPDSLLCAPVQLAGRYLGLIELANPHDGEVFTPADGHALSYIAEQFSEFLNERGLLIDPDAVLASLSLKS